MLTRAFGVWCVLLAVAFANGFVRVAWLIPSAGDRTGHIVSALTLSFAIALISWLTIGWIRPETSGDALGVGAFWLGLTLAFEFLAGHYLFGNPWETVLADYNVFDGRIWILVLITTAVSPLVTSWASGLIGLLRRP
jgi:hypothetical protein